MAGDSEAVPPRTQSRWDERLFAAGNISRLASREVERVNAEREIGALAPGLVVTAIRGDNPAAALGREVEKEVLGSCFGNGLDVLQREYAAYDNCSVFLVAIDPSTLAPAGALRLIEPSEQGLKTLRDIENPALPWGLSAAELAARMLPPAFVPAKTLDIATLAVKKQYRPDSGNQLDRISSLLYYAMYQWSRRAGYEHWVGILDTRPLEAIQKLGAPLDLFERVRPARYIDSKSSIPFYAHLDRVDSRLERAGLADFFIRGRGVDPSVAFELST